MVPRFAAMKGVFWSSVAFVAFCAVMADASWLPRLLTELQEEHEATKAEYASVTAEKEALEAEIASLSHKITMQREGLQAAQVLVNLIISASLHFFLCEALSTRSKGPIIAGVTHANFLSTST